MDKLVLNDVEARVLGVLIEKAFTTPDQYPLSLNAIRNGCNQKSNRDPQTSFVEAEVVVGLQGLVPKHLAGKVSEAGARVEKYRHTALECLRVDAGQLAVLAELLMRGPQTPGELRARVHRMVATPSLPELNERLEVLIERGFVTPVAPAPGSRAGRFAQLLAPELHPSESIASVASSGMPQASSPVPSPASPAGLASSATSQEAAAEPELLQRVERLESEVRELRGLVDGLVSELS